jgi:TPR repeat protein
MRKFYLLFLMALSVAIIWGQVTYSNALLKKAKAGDAEAQRDLALCYANGSGVEIDTLEYMKWLRLAAENGDAMAQFDMGISYEYGQIVDKDSLLAIKWYQAAAQNGYPAAMNSLANCYGYGNLVSPDSLEADKWWHLAAENGDIEAESLLGRHYSLSAYQDLPQAYKWFLLACNNATDGIDLKYNTYDMEDAKALLTPEQIAQVEQEVKVIQAKIDKKKKK